MTERIDVRAISAVGTLDFVNAFPRSGDKQFRCQIGGGTGNFEGKILATDFDPSSPGNFADITSLMVGAATFTQATPGFYFAPYLFGTVRVSVTSLQSTKSFNVAGSWK